jgi:hypothetical protein
MSDFGNLYAYIEELEAAIPPARLAEMKLKPPVPAPSPPIDEPTPAPAATKPAAEKK